MRRLETNKIDRKQWLAALHVKTAADGMAEEATASKADTMLNRQMEQAEGLLLAAAKPKGTYKVMERANIHTAGFSIEKHLEGCQQVILMAATLGAEVDALLRKTQVSDMALAVIIDAGASVLMEQICDNFQEIIKEEMRSSAHSVSEASLHQKMDLPQREQIYFTSRFSPGYGDYPLKEQKRVIQYLEGQKKIGLYVTQDSLMIPRKSVTALIGMADQPVKGKLASCDECVLKEKCTLKKEGKFCGDKL